MNLQSTTQSSSFNAPTSIHSNKLHYELIGTINNITGGAFNTVHYNPYLPWGKFSWGSVAAGDYALYDAADTDHLNPNHPTQPFNYALSQSRSLGYYSDAEELLSNYYSGLLNFRYLGGTTIHFDGGQTIRWAPESEVSIDLNTGQLTATFAFEFSADQSALVRSLVGSGSIEELYTSYIALAENGNDPVIQFARLIGTLTGFNGTISPYFGDEYEVKALEGILAGMFIGLNDPDGLENYGFGTLAFLYCHLNNNCDFTDLPLIPGYNLTNAGMLLRHFNALTENEQLRLTSFGTGIAPTELHTSSYSFVANSAATPFEIGFVTIPDHLNYTATDIAWGVWEPGSYSLTNAFGQSMPNHHYMPYIYSANTIEDSWLVDSLINYSYANHAPLVFELFAGPGMSLLNRKRLELNPNSVIIVNPNAVSGSPTSSEVTIFLNFIYDPDLLDQRFSVFSNARMIDLYSEAGVLLYSADDNTIFNTGRFHGSFVANQNQTALDALMAGIFLNLWDENDQENVDAYGIFLFMNCLYNEICHTTQYPGQYTVAQYWLGNSEAITFGRNDALSTLDLLVTSSADNTRIMLQENNLPLLIDQFNENEFWFSVDWDILNSAFNLDNFHRMSIPSNNAGEQSDTSVIWGYWQPNSYFLSDEHPDQSVDYDTDSNYHYVIIEAPTDLGQLSLLGSMGTVNYGLAGTSFALTNANSGTTLGMNSGQFAVNFADATFDIHLGFEDNSTLEALQQDVLDLFNTNTVDLLGTGIFESGQLNARLFGPEAEGIAAIIEGITASEEILRGIGIFTREP